MQGPLVESPRIEANANAPEFLRWDSPHNPHSLNPGPRENRAC